MRPWRKRVQAWVLIMATGSGMLALNGCDPAVRDTVLAGVSDAATSLASTFIEAFFQSLSKDETETPTTVQAEVLQTDIFT